MKTLTIAVPDGLWAEFKSVAHAQGVTYTSLAVGCIQRCLWPDMGMPTLTPFGGPDSAQDDTTGELRRRLNADKREGEKKEGQK